MESESQSQQPQQWFKSKRESLKEKVYNQLVNTKSLPQLVENSTANPKYVLVQRSTHTKEAGAALQLSDKYIEQANASRSNYNNNFQPKNSQGSGILNQRSQLTVHKLLNQGVSTTQEGHESSQYQFLDPSQPLLAIQSKDPYWQNLGQPRHNFHKASLSGSINQTPLKFDQTPKGVQQTSVYQSQKSIPQLNIQSSQISPYPQPQQAMTPLTRFMQPQQPGAIQQYQNADFTDDKKSVKDWFKDGIDAYRNKLKLQNSRASRHLIFRNSNGQGPSVTHVPSESSNLTLNNLTENQIIQLNQKGKLNLDEQLQLSLKQKQFQQQVIFNRNIHMNSQSLEKQQPPLRMSSVNKVPVRQTVLSPLSVKPVAIGLSRDSTLGDFDAPIDTMKVSRKAIVQRYEFQNQQRNGNLPISSHLSNPLSLSEQTGFPSGKKVQLEALVKELVSNDLHREQAMRREQGLKISGEKGQANKTLQISKKIEDKIRNILQIGDAKISIQIIPSNQNNEQQNNQSNTQSKQPITIKIKSDDIISHKVMGDNEYDIPINGMRIVPSRTSETRSLISQKYHSRQKTRDMIRANSQDKYEDDEAGEETEWKLIQQKFNGLDQGKNTFKKSRDFKVGHNKTSSTQINSQIISNLTQPLNFQIQQQNYARFKAVFNFDYEDFRGSTSAAYGPTKIQILQVQDPSVAESYMKHPINRVINLINNFILNIIKNKNLNSIPQSHIQNEFKRFGLQLPKNSNVNGLFIRSKEFLNSAKQQLYNLLFQIINQENEFNQKLYQDQHNSAQNLRYYIGKGNNGYLVKLLFKQRVTNWVQVAKKKGLEETTLENVNFIWTQIKRQHIMNCFDMVEKDKRDGEASATVSTANQSDFSVSSKFKNDLTTRSFSADLVFKSSDADSIIHSGQYEVKLPAQAIDQAQNDKSQSQPLRIYGKLENNYHLANKKALFMNMKNYYEALDQNPFNSIPLTFHIKDGVNDPVYYQFKRSFEEYARMANYKNVWIIKPGENTNRGNGIQVSNKLNEITHIITTTSPDQCYSTFIVQKYIERPLLIKKRKFDIRCYGLFTSVNGHQKGYFYNDGYIRTSCKEYNMNNLANKFIHLTNDAVQKKCDDYGKFENGNKLSFKEFQKYLDQNHGELSIDFQRDIFSQIKKLVQDTFRAVYTKMDPNKRLHGFEVFGYDFMIDEDFKIYLIEVNTNPCLETSCPLLARIISEMVDNSLRIAFDPMFLNYATQSSNQISLGQTSPDAKNQNSNNIMIGGGKNKNSQMQIDLSIPVLKYELVFDEKVDGQWLKQNVLSKIKDNEVIIVEEDEEEEEILQDEMDPDEEEE